MDRAEVWKLQDDVMPPFTDSREFQPSNSQSRYLFPSDEQFDYSFSSCVTSYDEYYTPSKRDSFGISDLDGLSSSRTSLGSNGSNSPVDDSVFYSMTPMTHMVKNEADDKSHLYVTSCDKNVQDLNMMNYGYSEVNDMYGSFELQHDFSGLPGMIFDNIPGLLFHDNASPLPMTSSPDNFVVPSQTFISEPYRPKTPTNVPRAILGSPLDGYGHSEERIKYFMSPRETQSQTPSSSYSSGSHSTLGRTPSSETLESSVALHRIQQIGGSRISKQSKRSPQVTSKIYRVAPGTFRCDHPGCKSEHGFKRHEHLKRHQRTHGAQKPLQCRFCPKKFQKDRSDNYREHVRLHTENKKGSRTKYFPEAIDEYNSLRKKVKDNKLGVPGEIYRVYSRRSKAGMFKSKL
jgi:hypothetical protein